MQSSVLKWFYEPGVKVSRLRIFLTSRAQRRLMPRRINGLREEKRL